MIPFARPDIPDGFERYVEPYRRRVSEAFQQRRPCSDLDEEPAKIKIPSHPWRREVYVALLTEAQGNKCAYCEATITNHPAHMDHYRPKGSLDRLDGERREGSLPHQVEGPPPVRVCPHGYWWYAYTWHNWLIACAVCNSSWKGALFPVEYVDDPCPDCLPLLLNPFEYRLDPCAHLAFRTTGAVVALSARGQATIETCGLHRPSLCTQRREVARKTFRNCAKFRLGSQRRVWCLVKRAVSDLVADGNDRAPHAGVTRSLVRQRLGLAWSEVLQLQQAVRLHGQLMRALGRGDRREGIAAAQALRPLGEGVGRAADLIRQMVAAQLDGGWADIVALAETAS